MFRRDKWIAWGVVTGFLAVALSACAPAAPQILEPGDIPVAPSIGQKAGQTDVPVFFVTGDDGLPFPNQPLAWTEGRELIGSTTQVADYDDMDVSGLPFVDGAVTSVAFVSLPGDERTRTAWKAWGYEVQLESGRGEWLPTLTPYRLVNGVPKSVKSEGGVYSLGLAYLDVSGQNVVAVFFGSINVTTNTGDFTFSTPAT
ncbi:MAG: hypothetical protein KIT69_16865 [Propionibacteriaceae bacterium]|nr:hypothetical protein [Propionibacteriaceae bacterium]